MREATLLHTFTRKTSNTRRIYDYEKMISRRSFLAAAGVSAAALALTACSRSDSGSSGSMSTNMGGSSSQTGQAGQNAAYRTGLGILTEASDQERAGKIDTIAAAVLLDAEGRVADVMLDEVEISVTGDSTGKVTMPTDDRTKRQKGDDYPLAAVSSLKKGAGQSRRMPLATILPAKPRMR